MKINEITCKTALSNSKLPGLDYTLNPYHGCAHQCMYCYVPSVLHMKQDEWKKYILVKRNMPLILAKELLKKRKGVVGISTVTDAYQPIEKKYQVTRYCLEQLLKYDFPIQIQTKSELVIRDIDLLTLFSKAEIMMSIGTFNEQDRQTLEPNSSTLIKRIRVLEELKDIKKLKTSVFLGPFYPNMTWKKTKELLDRLLDLNISSILIDNFHLKPGLQEQINSILPKDQSLTSGFNKNVFNSSNWFQKISNDIKQYVEKHSTDIKVKNAF